MIPEHRLTKRIITHKHTRTQKHKKHRRTAEKIRKKVVRREKTLVPYSKKNEEMVCQDKRTRNLLSVFYNGI